MKLFETNSDEIEMVISFFPTPVSSSLKFFSHDKFNFIGWIWKTFTTHFTGEVTQKSCVLKMADGKVY